jgi:AcrR family transcriptional regulator
MDVREMPRKYELRRRAERQEETRRRIVEATVALHESLGPGRTTISDIAARAGVERATVYRHFPDERTLFTACTGHYLAQHPLPDPRSWGEISDPVSRLRTALAEIYAYHRRTERIAEHTERDLPALPALQAVLEPGFAHWSRLREVLATGWPASEERRALVVAGIGHAIAFLTWRSLVREQGLDDEQAAAAMVAMVRCLAEDD